MANSNTILTATQQTELDNWAANQRAIEGALARLLDQMANQIAAYNAANGISTLLGLLAATDTVIDSSALAGIMPMTKQNHIDRVADFETITATYNTATYRALYAQAAGAVNL